MLLPATAEEAEWRREQQKPRVESWGEIVGLLVLHLLACGSTQARANKDLLKLLLLLKKREGKNFFDAKVDLRHSIPTSETAAAGKYSKYSFFPPFIYEPGPLISANTSGWSWWRKRVHRNHETGDYLVSRNINIFTANFICCYYPPKENPCNVKSPIFHVFTLKIWRI